MQLDPVEAALQTLAAGLKCLQQTSTSQAPGEWRELGGDDHLLARGWLHLGQKLTKQGLTASIQMPRPIGIRRIHEMKTGCNSC